MRAQADIERFSLVHPVVELVVIVVSRVELVVELVDITVTVRQHCHCQTTQSQRDNIVTVSQCISVSCLVSQIRQIQIVFNYW